MALRAEIAFPLSRDRTGALINGSQAMNCSHTLTFSV